MQNEPWFWQWGRSFMRKALCRYDGEEIRPTICMPERRTKPEPISGISCLLLLNLER